jgi:small subunit ribosomal protein S2
MQIPGAFARASTEQKMTESITLEKRTASRSVSGIRNAGILAGKSMTKTKKESSKMGKITVTDLLEAGVHFGHQTRRRNPKMKPYIYGARNGVTIFDLALTMRKLAEACAALRDIVADGGDVLFVGTKKQAQSVIRQAAETTGMHCVAYRWLGGLLTNNRVIASRVKRLKELRRMEEDGSMDDMPNKEASNARRELHKLDRNLGGIADMRKLPAAVVVVDIMREDIAVKEARKCGIPVIAIVDSNCDPDDIDYVVPGNDDALRSIRILMKAFLAGVTEGMAMSGREVQVEKTESQEQPVETEAAAESTESAPEEAKAEAPDAEVAEAEAPAEEEAEVAEIKEG